MPTNDKIITTTKNWVATVVVDLNLCPFAKGELQKNRVRFVTSDATTDEALLIDLESEIQTLENTPSIETTLLIIPDFLQDFSDYNQFLNYAEGLLHQMGLDTLYQIASFHPDYQFAGTEPTDAENYTNRSPYPVLHLLREESLDRVLETTEHAEQIPIRNVELMNREGSDQMQKRLNACFDQADRD